MRLQRGLVCCAWLASALLAGCAARETIPALHTASGSTGIEAESPQSHGPKTLLGNIGAPDVPSGTSVRLKRIQPLHKPGSHYLTAVVGSLEAVSIERPAAYNTPYRSFEKNVRLWNEVLADPHPPDEQMRRLLYNDQLSEIPWVNAGRCFHAKLRYRSFSWGKAVMFLTSYVQGRTGGPVNSDRLVLVVQGITNDGKYAVNVHFEIHHPRLPDSSWDKRTKGKAVFDLDEESKKAEAWLDTQPDDSFQPSFARYDAFLEGLRLDAADAR